MIAYEDDDITVCHGDVLDVLRQLPDDSLDSVVTDPPYGLEFMGKDWDAPWKDTRADKRGVVDPEAWGGNNAFSRARIRTGWASYGGDAATNGLAFQRWCQDWLVECLRVLKPGGHLLTFGGTRTWHRLACAIEDAGFEVRDSIAWLYGSGFPKSLDVSKAIDKLNGRDLEQRYELARHIKEQREACGVSRAEVAARFPQYKEVTVNWERTDPGNRVPTPADWYVLAPWLGLSEQWETLVNRVEAERQVIATRRNGVGNTSTSLHGQPGGFAWGRNSEFDVTAPATDDARQWEGWGTALKPAFEPIVVGRKPLSGTVAGNVLAHGTGALNIDACRVAGIKDVPASPRRAPQGVTYGELGNDPGTGSGWDPSTGRWPTNVLLDEDQAAVLDEQTGTLKSGEGNKRRRAHRTDAMAGTLNILDREEISYGDSGGASRFFPVFKYQAKAPKKERPVVDGVAHPTVKPLELMRWLVRLVTPPDGWVLDPFAGSGTTGEAALAEGFRCVLVEREAEYLPLIMARLGRVQRTEAVNE